MASEPIFYDDLDGRMVAKKGEKSRKSSRIANKGKGKAGKLNMFLDIILMISVLTSFS